VLGSGLNKEILGGAMAVPDFQSLMLPLLKVASAGPISAPELRSRVAEQLGLTESDLAELLPSGRKSTLANRTAWANVYLQRAGLLKVVRRGVYEATPEGLAVLERKPARIDMKFLEQFPSYAEWHERSAIAKDGDTTSDNDDVGGTIISSTNPEEQIERSHKELTAAVEADLLDRVRGVSPAQFEQVIVDLLVAMGYGGGRAEMAKAIGKSGDNGVDGVVREDKLGLDVVYMQAKRYASTNAVGVGEVRDFIGALEGHRATKGVFVTTSTFPKSAVEYVGRVSQRVVLIDGEQLAALMVAYGVGVRVRSRYEVKELDDDYFNE
jgi:restriction system protein